ncbi:hypothetical protein FQA39_LY00702 [Lamprigera yunnana]|nr:hypothetical protein FQA39_LY00702 [Lamprigera yunnana]
MGQNGTTNIIKDNNDPTNSTEIAGLSKTSITAKRLLPECYRWLQRETLGMLSLTALDAKMDKNDLIGAECACIQNSLRPVSSRRDAQKHLSLKVFTEHKRVQSEDQGNKSGASLELAKLVNLLD